MSEEKETTMSKIGGNNLVKPVTAPAAPVIVHAYSPSEQPPRSRISIKEFVYHATKIVEPYLTDSKTQLFAQRVTNDLNELLGQINYHRQKVEIFPEVFLTGVRMIAVPAEHSRNGRARIEVTHIETESMMDHPEHHGECAYIGRKHGVEMFIGFQRGLAPTIIFYKEGQSDYTTFNPAYMQLTQDNPDYEMIKEGINRYITAFGFIAMSH